MVNEFFSLYTAGILAFFLITIALIINRYFSMKLSDEEILINILMERKVIERDELKKITGFSDEKLDRMIESIDEIIAEGDEVRYAMPKRRKSK